MKLLRRVIPGSPMPWQAYARMDEDDLRAIHRYLRTLEEMLIAICARYGVATQRREGLTGVWVGEKKIASIGIGVRRWISLHGFALNVGGDLAPYRAITPCGIADVEMTSLERETGRTITVEAAAQVAAELAREHLRRDVAPAGSKV